MRIISFAKEFKSDKKTTSQCTTQIQYLDYDIPWGYFDGTSQGDPPHCGVGVVIYFNQTHFLYNTYLPGRGSNNNAASIGLYLLLEIENMKNICRLQVLDDSRLVINWANGRATVQNTGFEHIRQDIQHLTPTFEWITFNLIL